MILKFYNIVKRSFEYNLLFGRVSELVFSPAVVTFLDASVGPQSLDGFHIRAFEGGHTLKVDR